MGCDIHTPIFLKIKNLNKINLKSMKEKTEKILRIIGWSSIIFVIIATFSPMLFHKKNYFWSLSRALMLDAVQEVKLNKKQLEMGFNDFLGSTHPVERLIKGVTARKVTILGKTDNFGGIKYSHPQYLAEVRTFFNIKIGETLITGKIDFVE